MESRHVAVRMRVVREAQVVHHLRVALRRAIVGGGGGLGVGLARRLVGRLDRCGEGGSKEEGDGGREEGEELHLDVEWVVQG